VTLIFEILTPKSNQFNLVPHKLGENASTDTGYIVKTYSLGRADTWTEEWTEASKT